ncbi:type II/IV secretion system protein [Candidatus Dependentiae bacterium]|nr:type II/IV secretion system protein [Candidatus Dependentiae bacterium]
MSITAPEILDELIKNALEARASDIHIEPSLETFTIRFRVDGFLFFHTHLELSTGNQIIARIKVLSQANVAERRLPQDGKFTIEFLKQTFDIRVATFPCIHGEKVVLRLLDRSFKALQLDQLGLSREMYENILALAKKSHGFFLATGPTGSGKTTLLHALLRHINTIDLNIMTLEDPVEYTIERITQTTINPEIDLTFEKGLRSLLRLDPDIIMVGEIRDRETAHVAVKAALTGHFVVSTLHTTDAPSALLRLLAMQIEPFLIQAAVSGIIAQRLARRLCIHCRYPVPLTAEEKTIISSLDITLASAYKSTGCHQCKGTGYLGRIGIFQLLLLNCQIQSAMIHSPDYENISLHAALQGMKSLKYDAAIKVEAGLTSLSELIRVCG